MLRHSIIDTLLIAAVAGVAYWVLRAPTFYGDGGQLLFRVAWEQNDWQNHPLFLPLVGRLARALTRPGLPLFDAMALVSALGAALYVLASHRTAIVLGVSRGRAAVAATLCACMPVVVVFATLIEIQGPFLGCAGLVFWSAAALVREPRWWLAAFMGAATALAQGVHASGVLLLPVAFLLVASERSASGVERNDWVTPRELGAAILAHVLTLGVLLLVLRPDFAFSQLVHNELLSSVAPAEGFTTLLGRSLLLEWGVPFAPLSVVPLFALVIATPGFQRVVIWILPCLYLALGTWAMRGVCANGALLAPLTVFIALWVARSVPVPLGLAIAMATFPVTWRSFDAIQNRGFVRITQEMVAESFGAKPVGFMVGEPAEAVPVVRHAPKTPWLLVESFLRQHRGYEALCAAFRATATATDLYVTQNALDQLRAATDPAVVRFVKDELDKQYTMLGDPRTKFQLLLVRRN